MTLETMRKLAQKYGVQIDEPMLRFLHAAIQYYDRPLRRLSKKSRTKAPKPPAQEEQTSEQ